VRDRRFESNSRLFRHIKKHQGFRHYRRSDKWVLSPVLSPKEGHKRPWMVRTRRARATIHPSPANLAVATDAGQRLRKPCRNPGHLRYPRLHPACSQAARQGRARAPRSTMTKVGKSHSKGTFAGAFGNDGDAPVPALRAPRWNRRTRALGHLRLPGRMLADRARSACTQSHNTRRCHDEVAGYGPHVSVFAY